MMTRAFGDTHCVNDEYLDAKYSVRYDSGWYTVKLEWSDGKRETRVVGGGSFQTVMSNYACPAKGSKAYRSAVVEAALTYGKKVQ